MEKEESKTVNASSGNKEVSILDRAEALAQRIEAANVKAEEILQQNTEVLQRSILGGRSAAGTISQPEPVPISNREYAQKALRGEFNNEKR